MVKGISAVASAVNAFHTQCPDTKLVLVGYSQGGQSKCTLLSWVTESAGLFLVVSRQNRFAVETSRSFRAPKSLKQ
jgi:hypothetical protein